MCALGARPAAPAGREWTHLTHPKGGVKLQSLGSIAPSSENSSRAGIASHSAESSRISSSLRPRRRCRQTGLHISTLSPFPTPWRATSSRRLASRRTPSPHRSVGTILALADTLAMEACHTGRPEFTVSHLLTVRMRDHCSSRERYESLPPLALASGCVIAYPCIRVIHCQA